MFNSQIGLNRGKLLALVAAQAVTLSSDWIYFLGDLSLQIKSYDQRRMLFFQEDWTLWLHAGQRENTFPASVSVHPGTVVLGDCSILWFGSALKMDFPKLLLYIALRPHYAECRTTCTSTIGQCLFPNNMLLFWHMDKNKKPVIVI